MTKTPKSTRPSVDKSQLASSKKASETDSQSYGAIAIVFTIVGVTMLITDTARGAGIAFLVLGLTFFALTSSNHTSDKRK